MEKTRANTNGQLDRWNVHRAELTDMSLQNIDDHEVAKAFREWVVKGNSSPMYGDALYDLLLCKLVPGLKMNHNFFFKTVTNGENYVMYNSCVTRRKMGELPPMTHLNCIYLYTDTLELDLGNGARVKLACV
jgi:hypothetical protein